MSWLFCRRLGIDNPSYKYLASYFHCNKTIPKEVSVDEILKTTRLVEQVLTGWPLEGCFLYTKCAEFKKATDDYRKSLKKKEIGVEQEFGGFNG